MQQMKEETATTLAAALEAAHRLSGESQDREYSVLQEGPGAFHVMLTPVAAIRVAQERGRIVARVRAWRWPSAEWPQVTFGEDGTTHFSPPGLPMETYLEAHVMACAGCTWCTPLRRRAPLALER